MMELQEPVSRFESIRMQLSDLSWQQGFGNYFLENVPYSFPTSRFFAKKLSKLVKKISENKKKATYRIYEFGAGMGLLCRNLMDYMKTHYPKTYKDTIYYITDSSEEVINEIKKFKFFLGHKKHVSLNVVNAVRSKLIQDQKPDLILSIYLLDALPARHIEVENGQIYEILVRSHLPDNTMLIDTTQMPPMLLKAGGVKKLLRTSESARKMVLSRKILDSLIETYVRVPISKIRNMTVTEKKDLEAFVRYLNPTKRMRFNYSYAMSKWLKSIFRSANKDLKLYLYDFGYKDLSKIKTIEKLMLITGTTTFYGVCFPYLSYNAEKYGFVSLQNEAEEGVSRETLICNRRNLNFGKEMIRQISIQKILNMKNHTYEEVKHYKDENRLFPKQDLKEVYQNLSYVQKDSHALLSLIAQYLFTEKEFDQAKKISKKNLKNYHDLDYESMIFLGKIEANKKNTKKAETYFKNACHLAQVVPCAYYELALLYLKNRDKKRFIKYIKKFFKYCRNNDFWNSLVLLALVYFQENKPKQGSAIIVWINKILEEYPEMVPKSILPIFEKLRN